VSWELTIIGRIRKLEPGHQISRPLKGEALMKIKALFCSLIWLISLSVSCGSSTSDNATPQNMIVMGDTVGEMHFSRIDQYHGDIGMERYCDVDNPKEIGPITEEFTCEAVQGDRVFLNCLGHVADTDEELDKYFEETTWKMTVDDQPIDLASFGTLDMVADWDSDLAVRAWSVVIENISAGTHEFVCEGADEEEQWESHWLFTMLQQSESLTTLPEEAVVGQHGYTSENAELEFLLYVPEDYGRDPEAEWPLILYLHGYPKGLQSLSELRKRSMLQRELEEDADFPFIVVSPLRRAGEFDLEYWFRQKNVEPFFLLLEEIKSLYAVDPGRIYLSGESAGGNGVWEIGIQYPDRFAALVPLTGYFGWPFEVPDNICDLKEMPIWAFHGAKDEQVPLDAQQSLVDALKACGGQAQITVFPDLGHDLEAEHVYDSELITWMLSHTVK
jgi:predicted esterase